VKRLEDHTANDTHRTDKIWEEVQEAHKEFVDELGEMGTKHGPTLVHFSAQPEPFMTQNLPCTPPNTPYHLLNNP